MSFGGGSVCICVCFYGMQCQYFQGVIFPGSPGTSIQDMCVLHLLTAVAVAVAIDIAVANRLVPSLNFPLGPHAAKARLLSDAHII